MWHRRVKEIDNALKLIYDIRLAELVLLVHASYKVRSTIMQVLKHFLWFCKDYANIHLLGLNRSQYPGSQKLSPPKLNKQPLPVGQQVTVPNAPLIFCCCSLVNFWIPDNSKIFFIVYIFKVIGYK